VSYAIGFLAALVVFVATFLGIAVLFGMDTPFTKVATVFEFVFASWFAVVAYRSVVRKKQDEIRRLDRIYGKQK
jgi:hypothetical protein